MACTANDDVGNSANGLRILLTNTQPPTLTFSVLTEQPPSISSGGQPQSQTVETGANVTWRSPPRQPAHELPVVLQHQHNPAAGTMPC